MNHDLTPTPRRRAPFLELSFLVVAVAASSIAALADLGPRANQVSEVVAALLACATVWICLRRDICQWVNSRLEPTVAGMVLGPLAIALVVAATYTIATHRGSGQAQSVTEESPTKLV